jgi:C3HC zinc finger-like
MQFARSLTVKKMSQTFEMNENTAATKRIPRKEKPLIAEMDATDVESMHPADQAAADIRHHLDLVFPSFASSSPSKQQEDEQRRMQYRQRLRSFTTVGYFAQPIHLSPIICALVGWELQPQEQKESAKEGGVSPLSPSSSFCDSAARLSCPLCHAEILLWIPSILSTIGQVDLVQQYQQLLWKSHALQCRHRKEAEYLINTSLKPIRQPSNDSTLVVPTILARAIATPSAFPDTSSSSLELVEQPSPFSIFSQKWRQFYKHLLALSETPVQLPDAVIQFAPGTSFAGVTLLTRLVNLMQIEEGAKITLVDVDRAPNRTATEAAVALVLLGWDMLFSDGSDTTPPSIHCIFCLAQHPLITEDSNPSLTRKRPRDAVFSLWHQPWAAHRYYCPWVCGFPQTGRSATTQPLWEILAARLLQTGRDDDSDPPFSAVRQQIRAGVSPVRFLARPLRN